MEVETLSKSRQSLRLFVILFLFWVLLSGTLAVDVLAVGLLASAAITYLYHDGLSFLCGYRLTPQSFQATIRYILFFLKELVKSNIKLAGLVLSPDLPINPGIVKVRTKLQSPMGRLLLANSITLTPGTLTVELDGQWLYVHWVTMEATDIDAATAQIVEGFEHYLEVMYG